MIIKTLSNVGLNGNALNLAITIVIKNEKKGCISCKLQKLFKFIKLIIHQVCQLRTLRVLLSHWKALHVGF